MLNLIALDFHFFICLLCSCNHAIPPASIPGLAQLFLKLSLIPEFLGSFLHAQSRSLVPAKFLHRCDHFVSLLLKGQAPGKQGVGVT
jgi:hypothetical protein